MPRQSGTWAISVIYSRFFPPDTTSGIAGYSDDAPYFALTSSGSQWSLVSAADSRIMYPNWVGSASATPSITSATFSATPTPHDCINGACIMASTHGTPGMYGTLEECETACGTTGCSGKCISNSDWAQIQGLSNQLKNRNCG